MNCLRRMMMVGTVLIAASAGCGDDAPPPDTSGQIEVRLATQPSDVMVVHIVVTGVNFGTVEADMARVNGVWSLTLLNLPPMTELTVSAFAYADVERTHLIFQGATSHVTISIGNLTVVDITLLPNTTGGIGINTPPHITNLNHVDTMPSNQSTVIDAIAIDPDPDAQLTYSWSVDVGGSLVDAVTVGQASGAQVSVVYTPPEGFTGVAVIQLTVTDDRGAATTMAFSIAIGSGLEPVIHFDVMPILTIEAVERRELQPNGATKIFYKIAYPVVDQAQPTTHILASWSTSVGCTGAFGEYATERSISQGSEVNDTVVYTAPSTPPDSTGECRLTLSLTDDAGAALSSDVIVWINHPAHVTFVSSAVHDALFVNPQGADDFCQGVANAGIAQRTLPAGNYRALLSFGGTPLASTFSDAAYVLVDGTPLATGRAQLFGGRSLLHAINRDELGRNLGANVFTGALSDGTAAELEGTPANCQNWTTTDSGSIAMLGNTNVVDAGWIQFGAADCSHVASLYCVLDFDPPN